MSRFDDIIDMEWPRTGLQSRMSLNQRAKIFLPFAALTGYDAALKETLAAHEQALLEKKNTEQDFQSFL